MERSDLLLWMIAKSEAPVENGGLSHYLQGFKHPKLVVQDFFHQQKITILFGIIRPA